MVSVVKKGYENAAQRFGIFEADRHAASDLEGNIAHLLFHAAALFCQTDLHPPLILTIPSAGDIPFRFHLFKKGGHGTVVEIELCADIADGDIVLLPEHHKGDVLRVGDADGFKIRSVFADNFSGGSIEREAELMVELQRFVRAAGIGFVTLTLIGLVFMLFAYRVLNYLDIQIRKHSKRYELYLEFASNSGIRQFLEQLHKNNVRVSNMNVHKGVIKGDGPIVTITVELPTRREHENLVGLLQDNNQIRYFEGI